MCVNYTVKCVMYRAVSFDCSEIWPLARSSVNRYITSYSERALSKSYVYADTLKMRTGHRTASTCTAGKTLTHKPNNIAEADAMETFIISRMIGRGDMCEGSCRCKLTTLLQQA